MQIKRKRVNTKVEEPGGKKRGTEGTKGKRRPFSVKNNKTTPHITNNLTPIVHLKLAETRKPRGGGEAID